MTTIASSTSALTALLHAPLEAPPALDSLWMPFTPVLRTLEYSESAVFLIVP